MRRYDKPLTAEELDKRDDTDIDFTEQPELDQEFRAQAKVVMPEDHDLTQITARFDREVVKGFPSQGRGSQARRDAVLRSYDEAHK